MLLDPSLSLGEESQEGGKYDKNKSLASHHITIVLHNAQWRCQKCLGFSSFSFGTIRSGSGAADPNNSWCSHSCATLATPTHYAAAGLLNNTLSTRLQHYIATSTRCYTSRKQKLCVGGYVTFLVILGYIHT